MRTGLEGILRVPRDAGRLLARHWPALITTCLLGLSARQGVLWLAVLLSDTSSTLGVMLMPVASLCMIVALVIMLRILRPSLTALDPTSAQTPVIAVMLPFLAIYATQGMLREDSRGFVQDATLHESLTTFVSADYSRTLIAEGWLLVALVAVALVARRLLAAFAPATGVWGGIATYLEALWMVTLGAAFGSGIRELTTWVTTRQAWAWWDDLRTWLSSAIGPLSGPLTSVLDAVGAVLDNAGALVVVPVAWLSIGALVYGTRLPDPDENAEPEPAADPDAPTPTARAQAIGWAWAKAKDAAGAVLSPVTDPIKAAWKGFRQIAAAGTGAMVLFCLGFVAVQQLGTLVVWLLRLAIGPQEMLLSLSIAPYYALAARLVYLVAMVPLLAAAVNRILESPALTSAREAAEPTPAQVG